MSESALRLAVLGFPSDHLFGGGLTLLSRIGPAVRAAGGRMIWVDQFYAQDEAQLARWSREGVETLPLVQPRRWYRRWLERGRPSPCEVALDAFQPNIMIVAVGADRPYPNDRWEVKQRLTSRARAAGTLIVMMHQLSEAGHRIDSAPWLAWQRAADWHQFVSNATWRETEANFGFPLRGEVIRNNYQVPYHGAPAWPDPDGPLRLAFVGRFRIFQKGLDLLLDALGHPDLARRRDWRASLIGGGDAQAQIEEEIRRRGLAAQVAVRGHTADVPGIWREHHALIMPSRAEGLSLALCEAMLSERPAIASAVGGTTDLLVDGETGFLTQLDAASIAAAIARAIEAHRSGRLRIMGEAAGNRARATFPAEPEETYVRQLSALLHVKKPGTAA